MFFKIFLMVLVCQLILTVSFTGPRTTQERNLWIGLIEGVPYYNWAVPSHGLGSLSLFPDCGQIQCDQMPQVPTPMTVTTVK